MSATVPILFGLILIPFFIIIVAITIILIVCLFHRKKAKSQSCVPQEPVTPQQEEIRKILFEEADLFCSSTLEESFGMVFLEAMAQGVPCIGGEKSGAVPWVMGDGGVTCDVTKPEKLAECIERVMGDCDLRKKLSMNGLRRVKDNFDIDKIVETYEKELEKISKENS